MKQTVKSWAGLTLSASLRSAALLLWLVPSWQGTGFGQLIYEAPYTFVTIAGNPPNAIGGITNVSSRFNSPQGIAADKAGNLFVADTGNNTIRMIRRIILSGQTNWLVSTIAGSAGTSGSADGIGSAADQYLGGVYEPGASALNCPSAWSFNRTAVSSPAENLRIVFSTPGAGE
jgi:hypothetical protein